MEKTDNQSVDKGYGATGISHIVGGNVTSHSLEYNSAVFHNVKYN